jgi:hypothetical protein
MDFIAVLKRFFKKVAARFGGNATADILPNNQIRTIYKWEIKNAILGFLIDESTNPTKYRNDMKKSMVESFAAAFDVGLHGRRF